MFFFTSPGFLLAPLGTRPPSKEVGLRVGGRIASNTGFLSRLHMGHDLMLGIASRIASYWPHSDESCLLALIWWQFRVDRGWFGVSFGLAEILMRAGLGFVWGSFSLDMQDAVGRVSG